jgi:hypothetical protein
MVPLIPFLIPQLSVFIQFCLGDEVFHQKGCGVWANWREDICCALSTSLRQAFSISDQE